MVDAKKECTSRRIFCKRLAGVAVTGAFIGLETMASPNPVSKEEALINGVHLAGACGTYCGACPAYLAKHGEKEHQNRAPFGLAKAQKGIPPANWMNGLECDGCLSGGKLAGHCQRCNIRLCALDKEDNARCSDCDELPCFRITNLINMGNYLHRDEYLPNLKKMHEMGVEKWVQYEAERWRCPECRLPMRWYDAGCARCGAGRSEQVFPLDG